MVGRNMMAGFVIANRDGDMNRSSRLVSFDGQPRGALQQALVLGARHQMAEYGLGVANHPAFVGARRQSGAAVRHVAVLTCLTRSEEHTSELQSRQYLV